MKILNVDANDSVRYARSRILRRANFEVLEASTGADTLRLAADEKPDLVLLDVQLPDMSGVEVCHQLKGQPDTAPIMILQISATYTEAEYRVWSLDTSADSYLAEPVEPEVLIATIRTLLRLRRTEAELRQTQNALEERVKERTAELAQADTVLQNEISERERTTEQLSETQQFFRSTLNAMPGHIAILDETGVVLMVNAAWHRFAEANRYPNDSHGVGVNYLEICDSVPEDSECSLIAQEIGVGIRDIISGQRDIYVREYACHSPTEQRWFLMQATRFESQTRLRVVVAHDNVTEIKQAQLELQRQQEVIYQNEKLAAMSGLLANVAHELNNPLSVITMQADLLQEEAAGSELASLGSDINQAAERCVRIVRNFLALARQTSPERASVNLNTVIRDALQLLTPLLRTEDIDVALYLADELPPLWADSHQLHQVVVNLLTNAQQALQETQPPRRISLTTRVEPSTQQIQFEIQDNGPGIPPDVKERIFEPFFTTKELGIGTGLGLPLCQGIISSHGGDLSIDSQLGHGAVFRMVFPIRELANPPVESTPLAPLPVATGRTLLIVDDEVGTTKALARLFRRDGYTVEIAGNGHDALSMLQAQSYDVILCDFRMPGLDGQGLYRELERDGSELLSRFVFLTGDMLSPEARAFFDATEATYLVKPFRASEVRRIVQQVLQSLS